MPEHMGCLLQFSASVMWERWGCGDVVQPLDHLRDDYVEN